MPELPEIETLARRLRETVIGKRVDKVYLSGMPLRRPVPKDFGAKLKGRTIRKIQRRGKYLILELEPRVFWLMHLGMSGRVIYQTSATVGEKHTHAVIRFSDCTELVYHDPRRFGLLAAYEVLRPGRIPEIRSLGRDPMSSGLRSEWLWPLLQSSHQTIKSFLLDQHRIAGLGNIYVCEALFHARIHPKRRCCTLDFEEASCLVRGVRHVLRSGIRHNGTSISDFVDSNGNPGQNQLYLTVFQREEEDCIRCGTLIKRMIQGNRSSYFCPCCQK